ncbi:MAG: hypothetical protein K2O28_05980 [Clostridia bacterium]|nr:hypothetical protein [Clostridia bacterium]
MKTKFKLLIVLLATFCLSLDCGLIAACKEPDNTVDYGDPAKDGYIITVLYPDGSKVKGTDSSDPHGKVYVELVDAEGNLVDPSATSNLNEDGIAQINYYVPGEYFIQIYDYPEGYAFDNTSVKTSADRARYTVSLELDAPTPYTVNLEYFNEDPIPGVTVKLMNGTNTVATAVTNENGAAVTSTIVRGKYDIVLENMPEGYGYKKATTTVAAWPVTVTAVVLKDINFDKAHKLDEDGVAVWDEALNDYYLSTKRFDKTGDCYVYTAEFAAKEEVFFKIHAPKTGSYTIGSKKGNDYVIQFYSNDLTYVDDSLTISSKENDGNNVQNMRINDGETLIFSVKSAARKAGTVEVLVCLPVPEPIVTTATKADTYTLYFNDYNTAYLNFITSAGIGAGKYEITSLSDTYDVMIVEYVNGYPMEDANSDLPAPYEGYAGNDNGAKDGRNFVHTKNLTVSYVGNTFQYHIIIKDEIINYPVTIDVKIERTGDADKEIEVTKNTAEAHVDTKYADQEGTFTWMPTDGSLEPYRKDDGNWYVNVNGEEKALVVAITKTIRSQVYSFANIEYFGEESGEDSKPTPHRQNTNLTVYEDLTTLDTTWNYTGFIEKYAGYKDSDGVEHEGFVNSDGVYQVNDELKLFLERYMNQHHSNITGSTIAPAQPWLLGCGYYA